MSTPKTKIIKLKEAILNPIDTDEAKNYPLHLFQADGNIWRVDINNIKDATNHLEKYGDKARYRLCQTDKGKGYKTLRINGKFIYQHRILWEVYHNQKIPTGTGLTIDHRNRIKDDNRIDNIHLATNQEQAQNKSCYKGGSSTYKGVYWDKRAKKWVAQIRHPIEKYKNGRGKLIYLGLFVIEEDARDAYIKRAREYNEKFGCMYSC